MNKGFIRSKIQKAIDEGNLSHAYILEGSEAGGTGELAVFFVQAILCGNPGRRPCGTCVSCRKVLREEHEDFIVAEPAGLSIKDEDIEEIQRRLAKKPYEGTRNVALIKGADTMTPRAQNRLLKTLEEPPGQAVLILLSENAEHLLPTVRSRCILYHLDREQEEENEVVYSSRKAAEQIGAMLLDKRPFYELSEALTEVIAERETARLFLDELELWYRNLLLYSYAPELVACRSEEEQKFLQQNSALLKKEQCFRMTELIEEARRDLDRNINTGYALKGMVLGMMEQEEAIW